MKCEEVSELLSAYVLGALDKDEVSAVEEHLRTGHEHDDELADLRLTVFALDRFADEQSLEVTDAPRRSWLPRLIIPAGWRGKMSWPPARQVVMAAVVVLAVFASGWFVATVTGGPAQNVSVLVQGAGGEAITLNGATSQDDVRVTMSGLQRLPSDRVYQIWAIRDSEWMKIGICNTDAEGGWRGKFPFTIGPGDRVAVTVEPAGGSSSPTSTPLLISG